MRAAIAAFSLVPLLVPNAVMNGQERSRLEPGERVRITHSCPASGVPYGPPWCKVQAGTLTAVNEDGLLLTFGRQPRQLAFPIDSVRQIEVLRRLSRATMVGRGAAIGGGTLGTLTLVFGLMSIKECESFMELFCGASFDGVLAATAVAGGIGAGFGALVGSVVRRGRRWEKVSADRLRVSLVPRRGGRFAFGMTFVF